MRWCTTWFWMLFKKPNYSTLLIVLPLGVKGLSPLNTKQHSSFMPMSLGTSSTHLMVGYYVDLSGLNAILREHYLINAKQQEIM